MAESRAWKWDETTDEKWLHPCVESYYYAQLWKKEGRHTLLDLGCGLGRHAIFFAREGFSVSAADLSQYAIDHLRSWQQQLQLSISTVCCDIHALPFPDRFFDCVWAYHSVSHTDTAGFVTIRSELARVLKPGGALYITMCAKEHWGFSSGGRQLDANTVLVTNRPAEVNVPHYYISYEDIPRDFTGFTVRHVAKVFDYTNQDRLPCHFYIYATLQ